jgi:hypothetical protein
MIGERMERTKRIVAAYGGLFKINNIAKFASIPFFPAIEILEKRFVYLCVFAAI